MDRNLRLYMNHSLRFMFSHLNPHQYLLCDLRIIAGTVRIAHFTRPFTGRRFIGRQFAVHRYFVHHRVRFIDHRYFVHHRDPFFGHRYLDDRADHSATDNQIETTVIYDSALRKERAILN